MKNTRRGKPAVDQFRHPIPREAVLLAAPPKRSTPECGFRRMRTVIPIDCGQRFRSIADSVPVIADSCSRRRLRCSLGVVSVKLSTLAGVFRWFAQGLAVEGEAVG